MAVRFIDREDYEKSEVSISRLLRWEGFYFRMDAELDVHGQFDRGITEYRSPWSDSMPSTVFDKQVDMQFCQRWSLYMLEYGTYWRSSK